MAAFCELVIGLQAPYLSTFTAKMPKVSGRMPEYSRFRETATGDWVRSTLRGGHGSALGWKCRVMAVTTYLVEHTADPARWRHLGLPAKACALAADSRVES